MPKPTFYVYLMASQSGTLYTGMTNDLELRVQVHKQSKVPGFTQKYAVNKLVYYEEFQYVEDAILREKQIKGWGRNKKTKLIRESNSTWSDLSQDWFEE